MRPFENQVALVTGGNSGIGEATALAFARQGAKVVVAARRAEKCDQVVRALLDLGADALAVPTDVASQTSVRAMVETTLSRFGRLDCAVNNAGIAGVAQTPAAAIDEDIWDAVMNTNLKGAWMCMKYEIPAMLQAGQGAIVNVSSIYGLEGSDVGHAPYSTSKFGLIGLTKSAAIDYAQQGIRINAVAPGFTHSEMVDPVAEAAPQFFSTVLRRHSAMNRLGHAREIAAAITWLCSDAASFVNGAVLPIDGGPSSRLY